MVPPDANNYGYDFRRLGVRVPTVLVTPWLDQGGLTDTFDHTSILKFLVEKWNLPQSLGDRVASRQTNTFARYLRRTPRNIPLPRAPSPQYLPARYQTELTDHQRALVGMCELLASEIEDPSLKLAMMQRPDAPTARDELQLASDRFE